MADDREIAKSSDNEEWKTSLISPSVSEAYNEPHAVKVNINVGDSKQTSRPDPREELVSHQAPKKIVRKIEYWNEDSNHTVHSDEIEAEDLQKWTSDQPDMEHVEVLLTSYAKPPPLTDKDGKSKGKALKLPSSRMMGYSFMRIRSRAVRNALNHVVNYYPSENLSGDMIRINAPFCVIVHHAQQLKDFRDSLISEATHDSDPECENAKGIECLNYLLNTAESYHGDKIDQEKKRYSRDVPVATYDMLWLLFQPGTDVYVDFFETNEYTPCVVHRVDFRTKDWKVSSDYTITVWYMGTDYQFVGPVEVEMTITRFEGEKPITSIDLFPCQYFQGNERESADKRKTRLTERGRTWFDLQSKRCMWFDGLSFKYPQVHYMGYVMVDPDNGLNWIERTGRQEIVASLTKHTGELTGGGQSCPCQRCQRLFNSATRKPKFQGYSQINPLKTNTLTEHQYFLCPRYALAFIFKTRTWDRLKVEGFEKPKFSKNMFSELILPENSKQMIKYVTETFIKDITSHNVDGLQKLWSPDGLEGKGEGLIFLLHGKPGVGKTYTAECISQQLSRPLLTLTVADIGTNPSDIEARLERWFKMAKNWGAIVLVDEADVYLEERESTDLARNAIVAIFLRALEYYQGIIFLTTNRVGTFDEAILSRVHLMIHYHDFNNDDRKALWTSLFRRLQRNHENTIRLQRDAKSYVLEDPEMLSVQWNGREIRNAFQTAVALATAKGEKDDEGITLITEEHFQSVVRMSKEFKTYIRQALGGKSDAALARARGKR